MGIISYVGSNKSKSMAWCSFITAFIWLQIYSFIRAQLLALGFLYPLGNILLFYFHEWDSNRVFVYHHHHDSTANVSASGKISRNFVDDKSWCVYVFIENSVHKSETNKTIGIFVKIKNYRAKRVRREKISVAEWNYSPILDVKEIYVWCICLHVKRKTLK